MTNQPVVFLPRSASFLTEVELLAVVERTDDLPSYIAGAVIVRGMGYLGAVETAALAADVLDAEPLQALRDLLAAHDNEPVLLTLHAQGSGRSQARAWHVPGWSDSKLAQEGSQGREAQPIGEFLKDVLQPFIQPESGVFRPST